MSDRAAPIDEALVRDLVASQFPDWADLPVRRVEPGGWDNRTFRLGGSLAVRLPSAARYVAQVDKEREWLPRLAPALPLEIPSPVAIGAPGAGYLWPWSIRRWIDGRDARRGEVRDHDRFAETLARFLRALHAADADRGPTPGAHNFYRGGSLAVYDVETREAIAALGTGIDGSRALSLWERALESRWRGAPVWIHGDVAATNLLVRDGALVAVIDFGGLGVGDPACDLTIAWTFLDARGRAAFRASLGLDGATWTRARGWALWKASITLAGDRADAATRAGARAVLDAVIGEQGLERDGAT